MKTQQNLLIVLLSLTAIVLAAGMGALLTTDDAGAQVTVRCGRYVVCTGSFGANQELVYVLDMEKKKINIYFASDQTKTVERLTQVGL